MRHCLRALLAGLCLLLAGDVTAQQPVGDVATQQPVGDVAAQQPVDVPSGPATLRGRLVHATRPETVRGVRVLLYSLSADGEPGLRLAVTDAEGGFVFEEISNDPSTVYLVGTRVEEVPFGSRVSFAEGELSQSVEILVREHTSDASLLGDEEIQLRFDRGCTQLRVLHSHLLKNDGEAVIFVPPQERDGRAPLLRVELPTEAEGFETLVGSEGVERDGTTLRFWGPLHPGGQDLQFSYGLPLEKSLRFELGFDRADGRVRLLSPRRGTRVEAADSSPGDDVQLDGRSYRSRVGTLSAEGTLSLHVEPVPPGDEVRLESAGARIWLELDDASLEVNEQLELQVSGSSPLPPAADGPLLCLELPNGAEDLRFSSESLELGLSRDPSGALALRGPLPAGESALAFRYQLPVREEPFDFVRRFAGELPLLSVLIADTGVVVDTSRLHPRRPVRTQDRNYLHLEAFSVEPGEEVSLRLSRLSRARNLSGLAGSTVLLLGAAAALVFLVAPLRGRREAQPAAETRSREAGERELLVLALRDLEEDFETGKLSAEDHEAMRSELRARAVTLLAAERERERHPASPAPSDAPRPRLCPKCGHRRGARATASAAQCGTAVAAVSRKAAGRVTASSRSAAHAEWRSASGARRHCASLRLRAAPRRRQPRGARGERRGQVDPAAPRSRASARPSAGRLEVAGLCTRGIAPMREPASATWGTPLSSTRHSPPART